jgi:HK97 family phage portal protein
MNIGQRLLLGLRIISGGKVAYELLPQWLKGQPSYPDMHFQGNVVHGYRKNELIFACVSYKANAASSAYLRVYRKSDGKILPLHPLSTLIAQPNPFMTQFDFHSSTLALLDLAGRAYWEKVRNRAGLVGGLWPLRSDWVYPIQAGGAFISAYEYRVPGLQPVTLDPHDVLDFKVWDPLDQYRGLAPVTVAGRVGDVDNAITDFLKLFFEHGGVPSGLLTTKTKLVEGEAARIKARFGEQYGGFRKWVEPIVLDADAKYEKIGLDFKEMTFDALDKRNEKRICMVLHTPKILVGVEEGTYDNFKEARKQLWEDWLSAQFKRLRDEMQSDLAADFGDDVELRWDFSEVPALQEERNARWTRAMGGLAAGGITVNEYREEIGKMPVANGEVFVRSQLLMEIPAKTERAPKLLTDGHEHPGPDARTGKAEDRPEAPPDDDERRRHERKLERALRGSFEAQQSRVREALKTSGP